MGVGGFFYTLIPRQLLMLGRMVLAFYDCDYFFSGSDVRVANVGGDVRVGDLRGGPFYLYYGWNASIHIWHIGACVSFMIVMDAQVLMILLL